MKAEDINKLYFNDVDSPPVKFDRREFLKKLSGGVIIIFSLSELAFLTKTSEEDLPEFNAFLRVKEDGRVDCFTGKIEMGQGVNTSLPQALADELEVDVNDVDIVMGDTELCPYDAGTWGSMTTRFMDPMIRAAAAEARTVLIELASEKLGIPVGQLVAKNGNVLANSEKSKSVSYAELTKGKKIVRAVSEKPELKKAGEFKYVGK